MNDVIVVIDGLGNYASEVIDNQVKFTSNKDNAIWFLTWKQANEFIVAYTTQFETWEIKEISE